jgi:hypothetical protein
MLHLPTLSLRNYLGGMQSPFARSVAAVTRFARRLAGASRDKCFSDARNHADLERMERDYDRRDAGGVRAWDWR